MRWVHELDLGDAATDTGTNWGITKDSIVVFQTAYEANP